MSKRYFHLLSYEQTNLPIEDAKNIHKFRVHNAER